MSDTTGSTPAEGTPDTTPTEALQLADQEPIAAAPAAPAPSPAAHGSGGSHTRTILEVIGGVVAAGLIVMAGAVGFAVGHVTGGRRRSTGTSATPARDGRCRRPDAGGRARARVSAGMPGEHGFGGRGHQDGDGDGDGFMGHDDDGDGFMGGDDDGDGMMPQDGTLVPQG